MEAAHPPRRFDRLVMSALALAVLASVAAFAAVLLAQALVAALIVLAAVGFGMAGLAWAWPRVVQRGRPGP